MDEMTQRLEELLLCESLSPDDHDLIERCLEEGYAELAEDDKSTIRRLLNRSAASLGSTALQRWRERRRQRQQQTAPERNHSRSTSSKRGNNHARR